MSVDIDGDFKTSITEYSPRARSKGGGVPKYGPWTILSTSLTKTNVPLPFPIPCLNIYVQTLYPIDFGLTPVPIITVGSYTRDFFSGRIASNVFMCKIH
jgi:hypothetical protein